MKSSKRKAWAPYIFAIAFGVIGGAAVIYWGAPVSSTLAKNSKSSAQETGTITVRSLSAAELADLSRTSMAYAESMSARSCDEVIDMTWWMQERLRFVRLSGDDDAVVQAAHAELCDRVTSHRPEGNQLTAEGIEDRYVFVPGARIEAVAIDEGRDDLAKAVRHRTWLRVEFPTRERAPLDMKGKPLRGLLAGVNISTDGYILKAGILGNVELDTSSFSYDWARKGS